MGLPSDVEQEKNRARQHEPQQAPVARTAFIYVKIPVGQTADPLHQREYTLDQTLRDLGLGAVIGWGDSLGPVERDGSRPVAFLRIDINVNHLATARAALREILPKLGVPAGSEIHYTQDGASLMDIRAGDGWLLEQPLP